MSAAPPDKKTSVTQRIVIIPCLYTDWRVLSNIAHCLVSAFFLIDFTIAEIYVNVNDSVNANTITVNSPIEGWVIPKIFVCANPWNPASNSNADVMPINKYDRIMSNIILQLV